MSGELSILAIYGLLVIVTMVIQVTLAVPQFGLSYLASPRDDWRNPEGMAGRALRCVNNSVAAMALFAPAILLLQVQGAFSANTLLAAQIFLIARLIYAPLYLFGVAWLRTGTWVVGTLATAWLYLMAL